MVEIHDIIILPEEIEYKKKSKKKEILNIRQESEESLRLSYDNEEYTEDYDDIQWYYVVKSCNNLMWKYD